MYLLKKNIHTTTMKKNIRFTFLVVKLIPFALLSQLRSMASTKTLAYLAYKTYKAFNAFMAFKRSRFCPIQNYRSITSFCVDWPRTIRLVYASISILSVCAIMLQMIVKRLTKEFYGQKSHVRHVTRPCPCMTTLIITGFSVFEIFFPVPLCLIPTLE